jgi:hypothetical protein
VRLADPDARVTLPRDVLPAEKAILPVGVPVPEPGITFAVNTTGVLSVGAVGEAERVVVVPINAGGVFEPELPLPPQPIVKRTELNTIIVSARRTRRRRPGNPSITRPARLAMAPAPSHRPRDWASFGK